MDMQGQRVLHVTQAQAWDALVADEAGALVTEALHLSNPGLQDETTWQQLLDQMLGPVDAGAQLHQCHLALGLIARALEQRVVAAVGPGGAR